LDARVLGLGKFLGLGFGAGFRGYKFLGFWVEIIFLTLRFGEGFFRSGCRVQGLGKKFRVRV